MRPRSRFPELLRTVADVVERVERGDVIIRLPFEGPVLELTQELAAKLMHFDALLDEALSRGAGGPVRTPSKSPSVGVTPKPKQKRRTIRVEARVVASTPHNSSPGRR
jgi:hypothetical protein